MNSVHAPRDSAPKTHPIDRISMAESNIRSLAHVLDYALEKATEDEDGPPMAHIRNCLMLIAELADEVRGGLDAILDERAADRRRAAA